jgi:hypothetical protein
MMFRFRFGNEVAPARVFPSQGGAARINLRATEHVGDWDTFLEPLGVAMLPMVNPGSYQLLIKWR